VLKTLDLQNVTGEGESSKHKRTAIDVKLIKV
jgi:hypothetical protein